jgi:hypothetical protein
MPRQWTIFSGREAPRPARAAWGREQHGGPKRGEGIGSSGDTPQRGAKVIAITDHNGSGLAPVPVAPGNETEMVWLPEGLQALQRVAKQVGLELRGAYRNLAGGLDSSANRTGLCNAGLLPNITENPRPRKTTKRGRKRRFNAALQALRRRVERTCAWEEKCKRLW